MLISGKVQDYSIDGPQRIPHEALFIFGLYQGKKIACLENQRMALDTALG